MTDPTDTAVSRGYWARAVLNMASQGAVTQRSLAIVLKSHLDWSGRHHRFARALQDAFHAGYFEPPARFAITRSVWARWRGRPKPLAVLTDSGRRRLAELSGDG